MARTRVVVTGNNTVGSVLRATVIAWPGAPTPTYQWQRDGVDISGETSVTYTLVSGDVGKAITCEAVVEFESLALYGQANPFAPVYVPDVGTAPQTAVAMARLFETYTGPAARAVRSTDSATLDIPTAENLVDMTAFNAWKAGATTIDKFYDQAYVKNGGSANTNDFLQTTAGNRPVIRTENAFDGVQPITTGVSTNGNLNTIFLNRPATVVARQSFTNIFVVMLGGGLFNSNSPWALGTSATATDNMNLVYDSSGYTASGTTSAMYVLDNSYRNGGNYVVNTPTAIPVVITVVTNGTNTRYRVNGVQKGLAGLTTAISLTGGYLGKGAFAAGVNGPNDVLAELVYAATLSDSDIALVEAALMSKFGIQTEAKRVLFDGDSMTCGYNESGYLQNLPKLWAKNSAHSRTTNIVNFGIAGQTAAGVYGRAARSAAGVTDFARRVCHNWMGTNDLENGTTAATIWSASLLPYIQYMTDVSRFGSRVIVATTVPRGWTAGGVGIAAKETERLALNQLIRDNAATYGYTVADYGNIALLNGGVNGANPNYPNAAYYGTSTAVHVSPAGYELCRAILQPILDGMLA